MSRFSEEGEERDNLPQANRIIPHAGVAIEGERIASVGPRSAAWMTPPREPEWPPLSDEQQRHWAQKLSPRGIKTIEVYWGQEVEGEKRGLRERKGGREKGSELSIDTGEARSSGIRRWTFGVGRSTFDVRRLAQHRSP